MLTIFLHNSRLRSLAIGFAAAQLGRQIGWIALVWWLVNGERSPTLLGALFVAYQLPMMLSAPLAGSLLDQLGPKRIAAYCGFAATLALLAMTLLAWTSTMTLPLVFGLLVVVSLTTPATLIYRRTLIGQLVPTEELPAAYAIFSLASEASILLGPAVGGLIIGRWSTGGALFAFALGTAGYLVSIALSRYSRTEESQRSKLDLLSGAREIARRPLVLAITLLTFFFFLAYGPLEVALPLAAHLVFHTTAVGYGLMWTAYAVGSISGLLLLRSYYQRFSTTKVLCAIAVMWGLLAGAIAFTSSSHIAMALLFAAGLLWSPYNALESAFMQVQVPERVQGAVFSMQSSFLYTLAVPLGAMIGGWMIARTTPDSVILASGAACIVAGVIGWFAINGYTVTRRRTI